MSTWTFEDGYTCGGDCNWGACGGHDIKLLIQTTADTYSFYHDGELKAGGPIEELNLLGSLMMEAGDAGLL